MAISLLKDISYKNPDHIGIKNNLAVMLFEAKRLDEAIEQVRDIARTIPDSILIQCNLVMFLTAAGKTSEAYDILKELSARTPDDIHEALQLAILLVETGLQRMRCDYTTGYIPSFHTALPYVMGLPYAAFIRATMESRLNTIISCLKSILLTAWRSIIEGSARTRLLGKNYLSVHGELFGSGSRGGKAAFAIKRDAG